MLLRKKRLTADEAYEPTELLENMASANIIAQFGAKLDSMNAKLDAKLDGQSAALDAKLDGQSAALDAKLDAMNTKYNVLIWAIGFATAILSAAIFFT